MHAHITHNHFHATQKKFAEAILQFLRETIPENWRKFRYQVTDNFVAPRCPLDPHNITSKLSGFAVRCV